jgi:hypothetical protein
LILWAPSLGAQTKEYQVRQGLLRVDAGSIAFVDRKHPKNSRAWAFDEMKELVLGADSVRIVGYDRGRAWTFDRVPQELAKDWYPVLAAQRDQRFVAALADASVKPEWEIPVALVHLRKRSQGVLRVGAELVVYQSAQAGESRTWRMKDLENVASSDRFDLTVTTRERDFRFELKQALPEGRFDRLWRRVEEMK